jgi:hypothetical protein
VAGGAWRLGRRHFAIARHLFGAVSRDVASDCDKGFYASLSAMPPRSSAVPGMFWLTWRAVKGRMIYRAAAGPAAREVAFRARPGGRRAG